MDRIGRQVPRQQMLDAAALRNLRDFCENFSQILMGISFVGLSCFDDRVQSGTCVRARGGVGK
jgi:hypothetical protein